MHAYHRVGGWLGVLAGLLLGGCASSFEPAFDAPAPPGLFDSLALAEPDEALTFSRVERDGVHTLLAVRSYEAGKVAGVDLTRLLGRSATDPVDLFRDLGYDGLLRAVADAPPSAEIVVPAESLRMPLDLGAHHIAAGTNFPEHAGDAGVEDGPFLFAKLVQPTGPDADIPAGTGLTDYEVEVAWVALAPIRGPEAPEFVGLILCNDVTDRETLMRHLDPWDIASGRGFTTGKSFPGYLPVGNLFVIPRDHRRFVAALNLQLYVDGRLRQNSPAAEMIWDLDEMLAQTWARRSLGWDHRGQRVELLADGETIAPRTLLMAGTPHGTVFDGLRAKHYLRGLVSWLLGGWNEPIPTHVVSAYVADAHAAGAYLQPGNRVEIHVDRLGIMRNTVVP